MVSSTDTLTDRVVARMRSLGLEVLTHEQWGSAHRELYAQRLASRPVRVKRSDTFVGHISVTRDDGPLRGNFVADMREVERIGFDRFGSGFSYNFGVDNDGGRVGVGMPLLAKGTHTVNDKGVGDYTYDQNHAARAAAWLAMPGTKLSAGARRAFVVIEASMILEGALTESPDVLPHSFFAAKDCPTDALRSQLGPINREALALVREVRKGVPQRDETDLPRFRMARRIDVAADEAFRAGARREAALGHAAAELVRDGKVKP
jgi:hypothetical protein